MLISTDVQSTNYNSFSLHTFENLFINFGKFRIKNPKSLGCSPSFRGGRALLNPNDNGREYLTFDFGGLGHRAKKTTANGEPKFQPLTIMERMEVKMVNAIPKNSRAKIVERSFRALKDRLMRLFPTFTGGSPQEKPEDQDKPQEQNEAQAQAGKIQGSAVKTGDKGAVFPAVMAAGVSIAAAAWAIRRKMVR